MDSRESLVSMIAAGRGIFLGPEIGIGGRIAAIDFHRLNERHNQFELFTIWKKQSEGVPTIHKFIELLQESIKGFCSRLTKGDVFRRSWCKISKLGF